jgi:hypothetical protein
MALVRGIAEEILALRDAGKTYNEIAAILGCSKATVSYHCGDGQKGKTAARSRGLRGHIEAYVKHQKETNPCSDCNNFYPYYVMQYDHRPEHIKLFNIAKFHQHTKDITVVKAEMAKCDLVCANCHATRGHLRRMDLLGMLVDEEDF